MNIDSIEYSEYLDEVKNRVCALCNQTGTDEGMCSLSNTLECTIERYLPKIIQVTQMINSNVMDDYLVAFREHVCSECRKDGDLACTIRENEACGLDKYFPLILEAIEVVHAKHSQS